MLALAAFAGAFAAPPCASAVDRDADLAHTSAAPITASPSLGRSPRRFPPAIVGENVAITIEFESIVP